MNNSRISFGTLYINPEIYNMRTANKIVAEINKVKNELIEKSRDCDVNIDPNMSEPLSYEHLILTVKKLAEPTKGLLNKIREFFFPKTEHSFFAEVFPSSKTFSGNDFVKAVDAVKPEAMTKPAPKQDTLIRWF